MNRFWHDHSLSIILTILGLMLTAAGVWYVWPLDEDRIWDLLTGAGLGVGIIALYSWLSGPFRERNKPEK